ncbi:hypothetical protein E2I00_005647, partial [Balaenoptera physalus]
TLLRPGGPESLQAQLEGGVPGLELDLRLAHNGGTVIGLLRWKRAGSPRLHRQHHVRKLVEDANTSPETTCSSSSRSQWRNLESGGLAVYASPENEKPFLEKNLLRREGRPEKIQTKAVSCQGNGPHQLADYLNLFSLQNSKAELEEQWSKDGPAPRYHSQL